MRLMLTSGSAGMGGSSGAAAEMIAQGNETSGHGPAKPCGAGMVEVNVRQEDGVLILDGKSAGAAVSSSFTAGPARRRLQGVSHFAEIFASDILHYPWPSAFSPCPRVLWT